MATIKASGNMKTISIDTYAGMKKHLYENAALCDPGTYVALLDDCGMEDYDVVEEVFTRNGLNEESTSALVEFYGEDIWHQIHLCVWSISDSSVDAFYNYLNVGMTMQDYIEWVLYELQVLNESSTLEEAVERCVELITASWELPDLVYRAIVDGARDELVRIKGVLK